MKKIKKITAFALSAVLLSAAGCGTINEGAENKRLMIQQDDFSQSGEVSEENTDADIPETDKKTSSKKENQTEKEATESEKQIIEKAVKGSNAASENSEHNVSVKTYLNDTTDDSPVEGIYEDEIFEKAFLTFKPEFINSTYNIYYKKFKPSSLYSAQEAERLNSDINVILIDALNKYGYSSRTSTWKYQENYDYSPDSWATAVQNPGKLNNIWCVDIKNPDGTVLYDSRTLKAVTVEEFFGNDWRSYSDSDITDYSDFAKMDMICNLTFEDWQVTANFPKYAKLTALYKDINKDYVNLN